MCSSAFKGILTNFDVFKIFTKVSYPHVKFEEKYDGDVTETIQPTISMLSLIVVQKLSLESLKMVPVNFEDGFGFGDLENHHTRHFVKIERIL